MNENCEEIDVVAKNVYVMEQKYQFMNKCAFYLKRRIIKYM